MYSLNLNFTAVNPNSRGEPYNDKNIINKNEEKKSDLKSIKNAISSQLQQKLNFKTKEQENINDSSDVYYVNSNEISVSSRKQINPTNTRIDVESPSIVNFITTLKIPITSTTTTTTLTSNATTTTSGRYEYETNNDDISKLTSLITTKKKSSILNKNFNKTARHRKRLGIFRCF